MQARESRIAQNLEPVPIPPVQRPESGTTPLRANRSLSDRSSNSAQSGLIQVSKPGSRASCSASSTSPETQQQPVAYELPYPIRIGTPSDRLLELRLFHHYMQISHAWHPPDVPRNSLQSTWKQWVASLAMTDHTLMDAILGFSATNLRALYPSDRIVAQASYKYMQRAISNHAEQVRQGITDENAEVLFATSTFMALFSSMVPPSNTRGPPLHVSILPNLYYLELTTHKSSGFVHFRVQEPLQKLLAGGGFTIQRSKNISKKIWGVSAHSSHPDNQGMCTHLTSFWMTWTLMTMKLRLLLPTNTL
jgi:hypothetical protein